MHGKEIGKKKKKEKNAQNAEGWENCSLKYYSYRFVVVCYGSLYGYVIMLLPSEVERPRVVIHLSGHDVLLGLCCVPLMVYMMKYL